MTDIKKPANSNDSQRSTRNGGKHPASPGDGAGQLEELVKVGLALSQERDAATLLEMIVSTARRLTGADAGTLYLTDKTAQVLRFQILQNVTTNTNINAMRDSAISLPPPVQMLIDGQPNLANVSSYVAHTGETVNIPDVYAAEGFNFSGTKAYDLSSGYHSQSMLVVPMRNHLDEIIGVLQLLNAIDPDTGKIRPFLAFDSALISSVSSQAAVAVTNNTLLTQLREAYISTERTNQELSAALDSVRMVRLVGIVFVVVVALIGTGIYFSMSGWSLRNVISASSSGQIVAGQNASEKIDLIEVREQAMTKSVALTGQVEPIRQINVVSPFAGKVFEKAFEYGQHVASGELLLKMDTADLQLQWRDAKVAYIKEQQQLQELETWTTGREVNQARANVTRTQAASDEARRKHEEAKILFEKGIIAKVELDTAALACTEQEMNLKNIKDDLEGVLKRGNQSALDVARMAMLNVKALLDELESRLACAEIRAPIEGIVIVPIGSQGDKKTVERGVSLEQGAIILAIGDLSGFRVKSMVEEGNISMLSKGQQVSVFEDAYPETIFKGQILSISA
ncbi:MAG: GAF domain-containing protein, partial [Candidatus Riflebacteria bacterium]|nr:GAF domain-containing protein [Candidatus Riflebacteria bacterium]